jgi:hypothetical protein
MVLACKVKYDKYSQSEIHVHAKGEWEKEMRLREWGIHTYIYLSRGRKYIPAFSIRGRA